MPGFKGPGGPPPPPPPPPGTISGHFLAQKATFGPPTSVGLPGVRPKKKLKALHWEKVDEPLTTHWAAHTPSAEEREEKYLELSRKGILDEVEKLFMAKEIKKLGQGAAKKDDKKQIISTDLRKQFGMYCHHPRQICRANKGQKSLSLNSRSIQLNGWCR